MSARSLLKNQKKRLCMFFKEPKRRDSGRLIEWSLGRAQDRLRWFDINGSSILFFSCGHIFKREVWVACLAYLSVIFAELKVKVHWSIAGTTWRSLLEHWKWGRSLKVWTSTPSSKSGSSCLKTCWREGAIKLICRTSVYSKNTRHQQIMLLKM